MAFAGGAACRHERTRGAMSCRAGEADRSLGCSPLGFWWAFFTPGAGYQPAVHGGRYGSRTRDSQIRSLVLYPLS